MNRVPISTLWATVILSAPRLRAKDLEAAAATVAVNVASARYYRKQSAPKMSATKPHEPKCAV